MTPSIAPTASVGTVMHQGVINTAPQTTLLEAAAAMASHGVHCVVVEGLARGADRQEQLVWGILSDLDLMKGVAAGRPDATAGEFAATEIVTVDPSDTIEHVAQLMAEHDCTHLVVVSPETQLPVGVISSLDIADALAQS
jgi:CBS domain-containing protein